jgi:hypothetical protein
VTLEKIPDTRTEWRHGDRHRTPDSWAVLSVEPTGVHRWYARQGQTTSKLVLHGVDGEPHTLSKTYVLRLLNIAFAAANRKVTVWEEASGRFRGEIRQKRAGEEPLYLHFPPLDAASSREDALMASAHGVGKRLHRSLNKQ